MTPTVALRKTETSHHLSIDKANVPPEIFQKSSQLAELPQKPPPGDLPPKPTELAPKPQIGDLPPKPGELPPKPQLSDLPPKPQMKDLPPKPQLGDLLAKPQPGDVSPKAQPPSDVPPKSHAADLSPGVQSRDAVQKQASEDANDLTPTLPETPVPLPRKINTGKNKVRRVKTIYDCQADNDDELTFIEGEVIVVTGEEDQEWWVGTQGGGPAGPQTPPPPAPDPAVLSLPSAREAAAPAVRSLLTDCCLQCPRGQEGQAWVQPSLGADSLRPDRSPFSLQIGHIEGQPERKGVFPVSFVHILSD
ncbi:Arf-GAP with SH3 domain, ANK repeat and PH domain-containing protein 1 [Galemys pyrenaicus]|uniref:Arf-GAP with SH3 domain, ANK repeat and PH domain-containing protein 1 n=1 Tax=Galemys pyrenaicus TaxID=202257 RepID=A0A8J6DRA0_GALPY|nr:Arf-GAP with SH3 domain, ANK repeat and PH domain-containing protein 1 [Galemys pyrenaicus]